MEMETNIKAMNEAVYSYTTTAVRKTVDLQTALFKEWVDLNKSLFEMSPAKAFVSNITSSKK